jgi:GNAT superfamily N-acetyltransferase
MRASDRQAVTTLCAQMWDGHDYIPQVFDDWLAHPIGQFTAVIDEVRDALIGIGKLTSITERDWWIEGLRVDSNYRGRGVGRRLHAYHVDLWQQLSPPTSAVRLLTDSDNLVIHRLSERAGFRLMGDVLPYRAESIHAPHSFRKASSPVMLNSEGVKHLNDRIDFSLVQRSHYYQSHHHLYQTQTLWRWAELTPHTLTQNNIWLWREGRGLIIAEDVEETDNPVNAPCLYVDFVGVEQNDLVECLRDARALASSFNRPFVGVGLLLTDSILIEALTQAGYERAWKEGSLYLYEKRK